MTESFYSENELAEIGFASYGRNVKISRKASLYFVEKIRIGNHVRIDDFCILSGNIVLGDYIHIAALCGLFAGQCGIKMCDFSAISSKGVIYAESDDYSGEVLTNPMIPSDYRNVIGGRVTIGRHAIIGAGTTVLPDVTIGEGTAVGSMSLVNKSLDDWGIYAGIPCRRIKDRKKDLLRLEQQMYTETGEQ